LVLEAPEEMKLVHLTLNTGNTAVSDLRQEVDLRAVLPVLRPIIRAGRGAVAPVPHLMIEVPSVPVGAVFSIWCRGQPVVLNTVAWNQASAAAGWGPLESTYLQITDSAPLAAALGRAIPDPPERVPWLATLILPAIGLLEMGTIGMLGDLERCMAAVILREHGLTW
jgi:hypothetical protein